MKYEIQTKLGTHYVKVNGKVFASSTDRTIARHQLNRIKRLFKA